MIPLVVASERGIAQTVRVATHGRGSRTTVWHPYHERNVLESAILEGDNPVREVRRGLVAS